jgi:hypothetical protein
MMNLFIPVILLSNKLRYVRLNINVDKQKLEAEIPNYHANKSCP